MKLFMKRYGLLRDAEQEDGMGALNDVNVSEMGLLERQIWKSGSRLSHDKRCTMTK